MLPVYNMEGVITAESPCVFIQLLMMRLESVITAKAPSIRYTSQLVYLDCAFIAGGLGSPTRRQGAPTPRSTLAARNLAVSAYLGQRLFKPGAAPSLPESDIMGGWAGEWVWRLWPWAINNKFAVPSTEQSTWMALPVQRMCFSRHRTRGAITAMHPAMFPLICSNIADVLSKTNVTALPLLPAIHSRCA
jgi:hypothetical protein